jgi:hypothetical protein
LRAAEAEIGLPRPPPICSETRLVRPPSNVGLAVADLAGIEEFSDEITIKYLAGQLSIEEFDELERLSFS